VARGYLIEQGPEGVVREADSSTCAHCQRVTFVKPQPSGVVVAVARCGCCRGAVCEECYGKGCVPWLKQIERQEARARMLNAIGV
jgi:hypothetical protein